MIICDISVKYYAPKHIENKVKWLFYMYFVLFGCGSFKYHLLSRISIDVPAGGPPIIF